MYNTHMRVLLITLLLATQSGCAVYTVASTATWAVTGKTITDHGSSLASGGDCKITHPVQGQYYCEMPVVYNQSGI